MTDTGGFALRDGMHLAGLSWDDLWHRYFALGGSGTPQQLQQRVENSTDLDDEEYNTIAQAINEAFLDRALDHPVAYRNLPSSLPDDPEA